VIHQPQKESSNGKEEDGWREGDDKVYKKLEQGEEDDGKLKKKETVRYLPLPLPLLSLPLLLLSLPISSLPSLLLFPFPFLYSSSFTFSGSPIRPEYITARQFLRSQ